jgi:hypothetical protein
MFYGLSLTYGEFFPVYELSYDFSNRNRYVPVSIFNSQDTTIQLGINNQNWMENMVTAGVTIPYVLSSGNLFSRLWFSARYHHLWVDYENDLTGTDENFGALDFEIDMFVLQRVARQHINPRWGLTLNLQNLSTVGTVENNSRYFQVSSTAFLPGIFRNHSFFVNASIKTEPVRAQYKFRDNFFYARGYNATAHDNIWRVGFNYGMPLFYPDLALGPFLFIQRIKANFFYDISMSTRNSGTEEDFTPIQPQPALRFQVDSFNQQNNSVGVELTSDFRFMRGLDIDMGVRYSYLLNQQFPGQERHQFDLLILSIGY